MIWRSHNGELLGSYVGHSGVIWSVDSSFDSRQFLSGSGDSTARIWDTETGRCLLTHQLNSGVRCVDFATGSKMYLTLTDRTMGHQPVIRVYSSASPDKPIQEFCYSASQSKPTVAKWSDCNEKIVVAHDDGTMSLLDARSHLPIASEKLHSDSVGEFQFSHDKTFLITASKDCTAKIVDSDTLKCIKTYKTERPVNSAAISPIRDEVMLGGGQEAISVTTTAVRAGKFEVRFFDAIFEQEIGRVKGHFGPINTVAYHPQGTGFASGAEDGYVRLHAFDQEYYDFKL